MIFGGCDIGSLTSKGVLLKDNRIIGTAIIKSKPKPSESAEKIKETLFSNLNLKDTDISYWIGTGYGRERIAFVNESLSEITCHARGALWLLPSAKTVIDIGGQDCKAIRIDKQGKPARFITNDKCASGTGRFLEVMAKVLNISVDELGHLSLHAKSPITFASSCTVWAQADVIRHLNDGRSIEDIGAGINIAMANRVAILASSIGIEEDVCMTGGVAKNTGVLMSLEKLVGHKIKKPKKADPQLAGAIGAAALAQEKKS
ncbi:MAG: 2-hydroxyglutaryl-CoA dehydratase [Desulfobacterales bacterium]|nr:2-hydroxyglutaryl-CoA dehydratase [Desulfobacterales bacterium]